MTANSFWLFLKNVAAGMCKLHAFKELNLDFSNTTIYRLWKRFALSQSFFRTKLSGFSPPPEHGENKKTFHETLEHLNQILFTFQSPIESFQHKFQCSFL